jgi:hypothetical protein
MDHDELSHHLEAASAREGPHAGRLTARILGACWPGGPSDRLERAALAWVRRWRPERFGASVPACSCATGRCLVCN